MIDPDLRAAVVASYRWRGDKHDRWAADPVLIEQLVLAEQAETARIWAQRQEQQ